MWRFFYCQTVTDKEVVNDLGINKYVLLSQPSRQRLVAQRRLFDLLYQNRNRFKRRRLASHCIKRPTALPLLIVNLWL